MNMPHPASPAPRRFRRAGAVALLFALALPLASSERTAAAQSAGAADIAQARQLFNEGLVLRDKGDFAGAIEKFKAARALANTPIIGLELGRTYMQSGKLVDAQEELLSVVRSPVAAQESAHSTKARAEASKLAEQVGARIPTLFVKISGAPSASVVVTLDGATVRAEALAAPRPVDPGAHDVVVRASTGEKATTHVEVHEGEARTVVLTIELKDGSAATTDRAPAAEPAPAPAAIPEADMGASAPASPLRPVLLYAGVGLAVAGVAVGSVTGLMAMSKASSVKSACDGLLCPQSIDSDLSAGRTLGGVSTVAFAAAGVGVLVGTVGLLMHPQSRSGQAASAVGPWVGPGSAGVSGKFLF